MQRPIPPPTGLTTDAAGRAVVVHRARQPADRAALARQADLLRRADHPGVTRVVSFEDDGDEAVLALALAGNRTLRSAGRLGVEEIAGLVATTARTLADLHARGIVHGALDPDHLVLGPGGRPVLDGLGRLDAGGADPRTPGRRGARDATVGPDPDAPHARDGRDLPTVAAPHDDVAALGTMLHDLLLPLAGRGTADATGLVPDRRRWWPRSEGGWEVGALLNLADRATAEDPAARPSAARLAVDLEATVPNARLPGAAPAPPPARTRPDATRPPGRAHRPAPRWRARHRAALAAMGALLLALGLAGLRSADTARSSGDTTPARRPDGVGTAPASGSAASSSSTAPSLPEGAADGDPSATAPTPGRCDAPICTQVSTSGMVSHAGQRFAVGDPGDEVTVGDWDCDGSATVLVLRPRTGEVFAFAAWAGPAHDVPAAATTVAGPGSHLVPAPIDADGCSAPLVRTDDGRTSILALPEPGATP